MGVNYSASVGFGLAMPDTEANEYLSKSEPYEDGQIPEIMHATGWDEYIGYDYCGDWMGGPQVYFFYIKGTETLHQEVGFGPIIQDFGESPVINPEALRHLNSLAEHFGITGKIGWKLISNVS